MIDTVFRIKVRMSGYVLIGNRPIIGGPIIGYCLVGASLVGTKPLSLTVSEIFNGECDFKRPLNKGHRQDHSFWYQSISHTRIQTRDPFSFRGKR